MAICQHKTFHVFILLLLIPLTYSEIHRARTNTPKYTAKSAASYVAKSDSEETNQPQASSESRMNEGKWEIWCYSIFCAILVGLSGIFPLLVIPMEAGPALKHGKAASRLKLLLSFAVGGLLGDVFLHLLPEAWAHTDKGGEHNHDGHVTVGLWVIAGMLSFLIIEKMFAKEDEFEHLADECEEAEEELQSELQSELQHQSSHSSQDHTNDCIASRTRQRAKSNQNGQQSAPSHNHNSLLQNNSPSISKESKSKTPQKNNSIKVSGYLNLAANVIDNFTHGLAVAAGFLVSNKVGAITTLAILLHEIPHEVGDFAILLRSGFDRWKAAKAQLLTATGGMVGALTALMADSAQEAGDSTAWILPYTSGGFIYIALVTVVPDLLEETHPRESTKQILCLLAGIGAMYMVSLVH